MIKYELKKMQKESIFARGHVDATWQSRPRGVATWTHAAPTRRISIYIIHISIKFGLLSYGRVYDPLNRRVL